MSKHSKPNDDATTGKGGKPISSSSTTVQKAGSPAGKSARSIVPKQEACWTEVANFVVTFERRELATGAGVERRITAHKMQDDGITAKWTGVAQQPMCEWIANHVGDWADTERAQPIGIEADRATTGVPLPDIAAPGPTLAIARLRALATADHAPAGSGAQDEECRTSFECGEAFSLEALVEVSGLRDTGAAQIPPSVQFFSRNNVTKERARLGEASIIERGVQGQSSYRAILPSVRLAPGSYRLESVVTLQGKQPKLAYGQVPFLQVF